MGGSGGGNQNQWQSQVAQMQQQSDMAKMINQIASQEAAAQAASLKAQQEAIRQGQITAAESAGMQGSQLAQQQFGLQNQYQQAQDAAAKQAASGVGGFAATGGAFDPNAARAAQLTNLGAAAGSLPPSAYNQAGSGVTPKNPAMGNAAPANMGVTGASQFNLPSMQNVSFGGIK